MVNFSVLKNTNFPSLGASGYSNLGVPHGSQNIASSLETLNLNNMKPEVMDAFKAFLSVAQGGGSSAAGYGQPAPVNYGQQSPYGPPGGDGRGQRRGNGQQSGWRGPYGN